MVTFGIKFSIDCMFDLDSQIEQFYSLLSEKPDFVSVDFGINDGHVSALVGVEAPEEGEAIRKVVDAVSTSLNIVDLFGDVQVSNVAVWETV